MTLDPAIEIGISVSTNMPAICMVEKDVLLSAAPLLPAQAISRQQNKNIPRNSKGTISKARLLNISMPDASAIVCGKTLLIAMSKSSHGCVSITPSKLTEASINITNMISDLATGFSLNNPTAYGRKYHLPDSN